MENKILIQGTIEILWKLKLACERFSDEELRDYGNTDILVMSNVEAHVETMYLLLAWLPEAERPDWLTKKLIDLYAVEMFNVEYGGIFYVDKYFVDRERECVTQVYYNSEATSGGLLVVNVFDFSLIKEAYKDGNEGALE